MMLGVNGFSAILCLVSLFEQGTLFTSTKFLLSHSRFALDVFLLSFSNATGQLFIYVTIEQVILISPFDYFMCKIIVFLPILGALCKHAQTINLLFQFGPVVFAVVMTIRQILSIILSTLYFSHPINFVGVIGLIIAFGALIANNFKFCWAKSSKTEQKR
jgi:adenosine 3'-phospho 5'-phosphosulfate transporter B2